MYKQCHACGDMALPHFRTTDRNRRLSSEAFQYYRCAACGLIFLWPIPANLDEHYPVDYYSIPSSLAQLEREAAVERYKIDIVKRFVSCGRLLDIGPATGGFAYWAKDAGFEVDTIEMDARCCQFLTDVVGVGATNSADVRESLMTADPYDVITLWHVIEHLPDPWDVLEAAARRLAPNGILVIAAPNPDAFQFRVLGRRWTHIDAPRHLALIPIPLLERRVQKLGLLTRLVTTDDEGTRVWNTFGWRQSLAHLAPVGSGVRMSRLPRRLMRELGGIISWCVSQAERTGLRGSTYTIVFQNHQPG